MTKEEIQNRQQAKRKKIRNLKKGIDNIHTIVYSIIKKSKEEEINK